MNKSTQGLDGSHKDIDAQVELETINEHRLQEVVVLQVSRYCVLAHTLGSWKGNVVEGTDCPQGGMVHRGANEHNACEYVHKATRWNTMPAEWEGTWGA